MSRARRGFSALDARWRRVVRGASRLRNSRKLRDHLRETTRQAERANRRLGRLQQRLADSRTDNARALAQLEDARRLYIDVLKRALMHTLYRPLDIGARSARVERELDEEQTRAQGRDWPRFAQTMIGERRLDNVRHCVETVLREGVPGDFIETGVWRGGTCIFMRGLLKAHGDPPNRFVFVADSFEGLPSVDAEKYPADAPYLHNPKAESEGKPGSLVPSLLAVSQSEVRRNFQLYDLFDDRVRFLQGWFKDTLPTVRDRVWSVVRLDGDFYESTMDGLANLYPKLAVGGFLIVDDYSIDACRQAVEDYRNEQGITEPIKTVDWTCVYWRRER